VVNVNVTAAPSGIEDTLDVKLTTELESCRVIVGDTASTSPVTLPFLILITNDLLPSNAYGTVAREIFAKPLITLTVPDNEFALKLLADIAIFLFYCVI
jgi:hypothetical protein